MACGRAEVGAPAPGEVGAGEVLRGTVAGPVDGAPWGLNGIVGAGAGGLGAPPAVGGGVGADGAVLRGMVGAGAGGRGAEGAGGSTLSVTRTVSFFNGTADVCFIGVGGFGG